MPTADEMWALVAGPLETLRADTARQPDLPWPTHRENLRQALSSVPVADHLLRWLDGLSDSDRRTLLVGDDLAVRARQEVTRAVGAATTYDESAWSGFLTENGVRWDGTAESWPGFRDWFGYYATQAGLGTPATALLDHLDPMTPADRVTTFAGYGVRINAVQVNSVQINAPAADSYDEQEWYAYLAANGGRWDGTAESWDGFRQWFEYYATEAKLGKPATLLLDHLERMAPADRVVTLGQYGVVIRPPAPPVVDPRIAEVLDRLLARKPEYAQIPEARRIELATEVLRRKEGK